MLVGSRRKKMTCLSTSITQSMDADAQQIGLGKAG
jgi:hypothetical protein